MNTPINALDTKQAAEFIGCSVYTLREFVRQKRIPHYRVGAKIMFRITSLEKWIDNQEKDNYLRD